MSEAAAMSEPTSGTGSGSPWNFPFLQGKLASGIFYSFQISKERRVEYYLLGHVIFLIRSIKDVNDFFDSSTDCFDIFK